VKLGEDTAKLLRQALRGRSRAELKRLFAAVRTHDDRTLLSALAPPKKRAAKRKADPLVRDLEQTLKPILGPASEKADLLVEHLAKKHRRKLGIIPKGLADAARQLRAKNLSDDQIRAGARGLVAHLAKLYGGGESVV
jgi:cell division septum initiation protein DivIVA